jgi:hypothetical protein
VGFGLGNFIILTIEAAEIAAGGCQRKSFGARDKMKERFFLDRIGVDRTGIAVG